MRTIKQTAASDARLDVLVSEAADISRSQAARIIESGLCEVNGIARIKPSFKAQIGDELIVSLPEAAEPLVEGEDIPINILYEDSSLAVVEKPCGMVVHPAAGNESGTMVNALLYRLDGLSGIGGVKRPGIVHRLDKDTSGLLVVAKNDAAHESLSNQLKARTTEKHYLAVVEGVMKEQFGIIDKPIARSKHDRKKMAVDAEGRESFTEWTLIEPLKAASLLDVHILTGRTHQIRVHMQSIGHPVAGDPIYGLRGGVKAPRLMLHSFSLAFDHPVSGERMRFTLPPPPTFLECVKKLCGTHYL